MSPSLTDQFHVCATLLRLELLGLLSGASVLGITHHNLTECPSGVLGMIQSLLDQLTTHLLLRRAHA